MSTAVDADDGSTPFSAAVPTTELFFICSVFARFASRSVSSVKLTALGVGSCPGAKAGAGDEGAATVSCDSEAGNGFGADSLISEVCKWGERK